MNKKEFLAQIKKECGEKTSNANWLKELISTSNKIETSDVMECIYKSSLAPLLACIFLNTEGRPLSNPELKKLNKLAGIDIEESYTKYLNKVNVNEPARSLSITSNIINERLVPAAFPLSKAIEDDFFDVQGRRTAKILSFFEKECSIKLHSKKTYIKAFYDATIDILKLWDEVFKKNINKKTPLPPLNHLDVLKESSDVFFESAGKYIEPLRIVSKRFIENTIKKENAEDILIGALLILSNNEWILRTNIFRTVICLAAHVHGGLAVPDMVNRIPVFVVDKESNRMITNDSLIDTFTGAEKEEIAIHIKNFYQAVNLNCDMREDDVGEVAINSSYIMDIDGAAVTVKKFIRQICGSYFDDDIKITKRQKEFVETTNLSEREKRDLLIAMATINHMRRIRNDECYAYFEYLDTEQSEDIKNISKIEKISNEEKEGQANLVVSSNTENSEFEKKIKQLEKENKAYRHEIRMLKKQLDEIVSKNEEDVIEAVEEVTTPETLDDTESYSFPYSTDVRAVLFGGFESFKRDVNALLPDLKIISNGKMVDTSLLNNADILFIQNNCCKHNKYNAIRDTAKAFGIKIIHFNNASPKVCANIMVKHIKELEEDYSEN